MRCLILLVPLSPHLLLTQELDQEEILYLQIQAKEIFLLMNQKRVNYLSCIEGKGGLRDIHFSALKAALFVELLKNIF